jgi:cytochrome b involved in lipid metabolism
MIGNRRLREVEKEGWLYFVSTDASKGRKEKKEKKAKLSQERRKEKKDKKAKLSQKKRKRTGNVMMMSRRLLEQRLDRLFSSMNWGILSRSTCDFFPTLILKPIMSEEKKLKQISLEEVAKHNKADDCWIAVDNFVRKSLSFQISSLALFMLESLCCCRSTTFPISSSSILVVLTSW